MKFIILILTMTLGTIAQAQTTNIRTSVASLAVAERPNVRADFQISEKLSLGADVGNQSYDDSGVSVKGMSAGIYATLYTRGTFKSGWTVDFGLIYAKLKGEATVAGVTRSGDTTNIGVRVLGGYHWFWEPFNLSLGIGYASNSEDRLEIKDAVGNVAVAADLEPVAMAADFSIGLSF